MRKQKEKNTYGKTLLIKDMTKIINMTFPQLPSLLQKPSLTLKHQAMLFFFLSFSIPSRFGCLARHLFPQPGAKHLGLTLGSKTCEHMGQMAAAPPWAIKANKGAAPITVLGRFRKVCVFSSGILWAWLQTLYILILCIIYSWRLSS